MMMYHSNYKLIPDELKQTKNWCCFKLVKNDARDKFDKIPYNPLTNSKAQSNNTDTWCDFDTCYNAYISSDLFDGLGFFFAPPYFGVDIDNITDDIEKFNKGNPENIVSEFVNVLQSYSEYSVSKKGIHIICKGSLPSGRRRKNNVEMYQQGRFFVMTGDSLEMFDDIAECTNTISYLHEKYLGKNETNVLTNLDSHDLETDEIIERIKRSNQADKFNRLFDGNFKDEYPSQSEADFAFAEILAFWTGCNEWKMDTIFRQSGLYRAKYDRRLDDSTYGEITIRNAIEKCTSIYQPKKSDENYSITIENLEYGIVHSFDDTGNASRFVDRFKSKTLYCFQNKKWYVFDGIKWCVKDLGTIKLLADCIVNEMRKEYAWIKHDDRDIEEDIRKQLTKHINRSRSSKGKENMLKEAQQNIQIELQDFDKNDLLFNTQNGYLALNENVLKSHNRNERMTKVSNVEYSNSAKCELWLKFLNEIFLEDQEIIEYIQRALGYSLSGLTLEQCMFILVGHGRNGKSVFLDVLKEIYGSYACNVQSESLMIKTKLTGANPEIARLVDVRFVICSESQEGERLNEAMIKQLTGGDIISIRGLYQDTFEFKPKFKIWMATNHKPIIRGTDLGIWRRLHLIKFNYTVEESKIDKNLTYKLKRELPGILNWIVEGYEKYKQIGLKPPKSVLESVEEYKQEMDVISQFLDACCIRDNISMIRASTLYSYYKEWAKDNNHYIFTSTKFGRELTERFNLEKIKKNDGLYYVGLKSNYDGIKKYIGW